MDRDIDGGLPAELAVDPNSFFDGKGLLAENGYRPIGTSRSGRDNIWNSNLVLQYMVPYDWRSGPDWHKHDGLHREINLDGVMNTPSCLYGRVFDYRIRPPANRQRFSLFSNDDMKRVQHVACQLAFKHCLDSNNRHEVTIDQTVKCLSEVLS